MTQLAEAARLRAPGAGARPARSALRERGRVRRSWAPTARLHRVSSRHRCPRARRPGRARAGALAGSSRRRPPTGRWRRRRPCGRRSGSTESGGGKRLRRLFTALPPPPPWPEGRISDSGLDPLHPLGRLPRSTESRPCRLEGLEPMAPYFWPGHRDAGSAPVEVKLRRSDSSPHPLARQPRALRHQLPRDLAGARCSPSTAWFIRRMAAASMRPASAASAAASPGCAAQARRVHDRHRVVGREVAAVVLQHDQVERGDQAVGRAAHHEVHLARAPAPGRAGPGPSPAARGPKRKP